MRCVRCKRHINTAAVAVHKGAKVYGYGPKCARLAGLIEHKPRSQQIRTQAEPVDPDQIPLPLEMAA